MVINHGHFSAEPLGRCGWARPIHTEAADPLDSGTGSDVTIRELAERIPELVRFSGGVDFDPTRSDGAH